MAVNVLTIMKIMYVNVVMLMETLQIITVAVMQIAQKLLMETSPALMERFYHLHKVVIMNAPPIPGRILWPFHQHVTIMLDALLMMSIPRFVSILMKSKIRSLNPFVILILRVKEFHVQHLFIICKTSLASKMMNYSKFT